VRVEQLVPVKMNAPLAPLAPLEHVAEPRRV
jgi:hypothetical protein